MGILDKIFGPPPEAVKFNQIDTGHQKAAPAIEPDNQLMQAVFRYVGESLRLMQQDPNSYIAEAYKRNQDVFAVVRAIARRTASIPWIAYKVTDRTKHQRYEMLRKGGTPEARFQAERYFKQATEIIDDHRVLGIIEEPNAWTSGRLFREASVTYSLLTGNSLWYANGPEAADGSPLRTRELWNIPTAMISPKISRDFFQPVSGWEFAHEPGNIIPTAKILHIKNFNPVEATGGTGTAEQLIWGMSPLMAAALTVDQGNANMVGMIKQMQNAGAYGMIAARAAGRDAAGNAFSLFSQEQAAALRLAMDQNTNGMNNRGKINFTPGVVDFIRFGLSPVELAVIDAMQMTLRQICNIYGVNSALFNDPENRTYNNMREARKSMITDAVVPELDDLRHGYNWLADHHKEGDRQTVYIDYDLEAVPEMQEDMGQLADTLATSDWLTINEKREAMKYPIYDDPRADVPERLENMAGTGDGLTDEDLLKALRRDGVRDYE